MLAKHTNRNHAVTKTGILMAGCSNLHLWPVSRINNPIQFQKTVGALSPFQLAASALAEIPNLTTLWVTVSVNCIAIASSQLAELDIKQPTNLMVEPVERGDLCALMAVLLANEHAQNTHVIALDANQPPTDLACFHRLTEQLTCSNAEEDKIIVCCEKSIRTTINPIHLGDALGHNHLFTIASEGNLQSPEHAYSGLVFIPPHHKVKNLTAIVTRVRATCKKALASATGLETGIWPNTNLWSALPTLEITDLLNEPSNNLAVRPTDLKVPEPTSAPPVSNTHFFDNGHLVAIAGEIDVEVLTSADATLVKPRNAQFDTESLLNSLKLADRPELFDTMSRSYSWGRETLLERRQGYSVQQIEIMPGNSIKPHFHNHRSETWHILSGFGETEIDGEQVNVSRGDIIEIPSNAIHSLKNTGQKTLFALEIRQGSFLSQVDNVVA